MTRKQYRIVGAEPEFGIEAVKGGIIYDLLPKADAVNVCAVLNSGVGPEWDAVEAELERRGKL